MDDNEAHLSPLWRGRRKPFRKLMTTLAGLGIAYDVRNHGTTGERFRITIQDIHGVPIEGSCTIPLEALDDLLLAVQDLRKRRREENRDNGHALQCFADRDLAYMDSRIARGETPDFVRARAREYYAEAAQRTKQPDLEQLTATTPPAGHSRTHTSDGPDSKAVWDGDTSSPGNPQV